MSASILSRRLLVPFLLGMTMVCAPRHATAVTITVGNGGCQYIGLQFALDELESQPGPHTIRLKSQTIAIPNGLVLDTSNTSYTFIGGHANCGDAQPTAGQRTILDASGGNDGTAFAINGNSSTQTPFITLSGVTVRGGNSETGPFSNPEGGGLEIRGRVSVILSDRTQIQNNVTGRGGGVYLRGDNVDELASLTVIGDSWIIANTATKTGGGIYCQQHGRVSLNNGQISYNEAQGIDEFGFGGGARLLDTCRLSALAEAGSRTGILFNIAASSGGGLFIETSDDMNLRGAMDAPFWFEGNRSGADGGAMEYRVEGQVAADLRLENVVFLDNFARRWGAAFSILGAPDIYFGPRTGSSNCSFPGVGYGACAAVIGSDAQQNVSNRGAIHFGGVLTVRRAAFIDNRSQHLFSTAGSSRFDIENSILRGNRILHHSSGDYPNALIRVESFGIDSEHRFAFNTVIDSSSTGAVPSLFSTDLADVDVTGSILHAPSFGFRDAGSSGLYTHNGCLLVASAAGVPSVPAAPVVGDPGLASDLTPSAASPALDQCSTSLAPSTDFRGNARSLDQPAVANRFGPVDLGAIERPLDPPPTAPNLTISRSSITIPDGSTTPFVANVTDFGSVNLGSSMLHLYSVRNTGSEALTFSAHNVSGACAENFRVAALPGSLGAGVSGILGIRFEPIEAGECIVTYQIFSNDPDNSPYDFQLRGVGVGVDIFADGFE